MILEKNSKLIMIGDSITDCGRLKPIGEAKNGAYGDGYVNLVNAFLCANYPERQIRVINMGISGNTVRDLKNRWQTDVVDLKPDYVSIMIGINDVWRQLDRPFQKEHHIDIEEYELTLDELVKETISKVKQVILISPYVIETNKLDTMRKLMDDYKEVVKKIANKYQTIYVDTQVEFDKQLDYYHSSFFAWDRVHPNTSGHFVIAKAFLNSIQFDFNKQPL